MRFQFRAQEDEPAVGVGEWLDIGRLLDGNAKDGLAVRGEFLAAIFGYDSVGDFDYMVGEGSYRFVIGHTGPCGVAVEVFDLPILLLHPAITNNNTNDCAGGGGVIVGIPAKVECVD